MADFLTIQTQTAWGQTLDAFARWCNPRPGWRILDAGCGPGLFPALLARYGCWTVGIDLDFDVIRSGRLHDRLLQADAFHLPFASRSFNLVTASNLLFLLPEPQRAMLEIVRLVTPGGQVAVLNPSEKMSLSSARLLADQHGLEGAARESLLNWAMRAEKYQRWTERELNSLFRQAGLHLVETTLRIGPGLARMARGILIDAREEPPFLQ